MTDVRYQIQDEVLWSFLLHVGKEILTHSRNAKELSFFDAQYPIDPLNDLVAANNSPTGEDLETKWGAGVNFPANHELSITQYKKKSSICVGVFRKIILGSIVS